MSIFSSDENCNYDIFMSKDGQQCQRKTHEDLGVGTIQCTMQMGNFILCHFFFFELKSSMAHSMTVVRRMRNQTHQIIIEK